MMVFEFSAVCLAGYFLQPKHAGIRELPNLSALGWKTGRYGLIYAVKSFFDYAGDLEDNNMIIPEYMNK